MNRKDSFGAFFVSTMGTEGTGTSVPMMNDEVFIGFYKVINIKEQL